MIINKITITWGVKYFPNYEYNIPQSVSPISMSIHSPDIHHEITNISPLPIKNTYPYWRLSSISCNSFPSTFPLICSFSNWWTVETTSFYNIDRG
jgi:hypothetical protein